MNSKFAVCVVADFKYLIKYFSNFKKNLQNEGKYDGEILIITSVLTPTFFLPSTFGSKIKNIEKEKN